VHRSTAVWEAVRLWQQILVKLISKERDGVVFTTVVHIISLLCTINKILTKIIYDFCHICGVYCLPNNYSVPGIRKHEVQLGTQNRKERIGNALHICLCSCTKKRFRQTSPVNLETSNVPDFTGRSTDVSGDHNAIRAIKSRRMRCVMHVARTVQIINKWIILVWKREQNEARGRIDLRERWRQHEFYRQFVKTCARFIWLSEGFCQHGPEHLG
jgi:uncharacterized membrane protein YuzA (DUF378 family)